MVSAPPLRVLRCSAVALAFVLAVVNAATVEQLTADKDRCLRRLERVEDHLDFAARTLARISRGATGDWIAKAEQMQARAVQFRERADGLWGRVGEIESDLAQAQGVCSECLSTKVDAFCRLVEGVEEDAAGYRAVVADAERAAAIAPRSPDTARPGPEPGASDSTRRIPSGTWKVGAGADYTHIEDVEQVLTPLGRDSLAGVQDDPMTGFAKASYEWTPHVGRLERLEPSIRVANTWGSAGLAGDVRLLGEYVRLELEGEAAKRLWGRSGDWVGSARDSLDKVSVRAAFLASNEVSTGPLQFSVPLELHTLAHRHAVAGHRSYRSYELAPSLALRPGKGLGEVRVSAGVEYRDGFDPDGGKDSLDVVRTQAALDGGVWGKVVSADGRVGYWQDRYLERSEPWRLQTVGGDGRVSARLAERVRLRLTGRCEYSREDHAGLLAVRYDTVVVLPYVGRDTIAVRDTFGQAMVLEGAAWRAAPEVEVRVAGPLWLTVGLEYRAGRYSAEDSARGRELDAARYLDESHDRLEPGIGIRLDGSRGQARLTGAYLYEHVIESNAWSTASSRGGRVEGEVLWSIFPWLSVSLLGEYQVRRFLDRTDHYGINGYLSVSLSALLPGR